MKTGDLIKWTWYLDGVGTPTKLSGIVVGSRVAKTDREKVMIYSVLCDDGHIDDVREDVPTLEVVNAVR